MPEDALLLFFVTVVGLCLGSFYNVVILRGLSGESIVFPGSKCPMCSKSLKWWHNIPVISYLCLGGKCAFCKTKISLQYPLVEIFTAILFVATYLHWGLNFKSVLFCVILSLFLIVTLTDLKERVILTRHAYILAFCGVCYSILMYFNPADAVYTQNALLVSLSGIITGSVVMELMARVGFIFAKQRAFGEGDTYIAGALGALFGWKYILVVLLLGFVIQFVISLPIFLYNLFKVGKSRLALELIVFLMFAFGMWVYGSILEDVIYYSGLLLLVIIAVHLARGILRDISSPTGLTYLPYVPALILASVPVLFMYF